MYRFVLPGPSVPSGADLAAMPHRIGEAQPNAPGGTQIT
jgi:hypothetical protein